MLKQLRQARFEREVKKVNELKERIENLKEHKNFVEELAKDYLRKGFKLNEKGLVEQANEQFNLHEKELEEVKTIEKQIKKLEKRLK